MNIPRQEQRTLLLRVARKAMLEHGLEPEFPIAALAEAQHLTLAGAPFGDDVRDLREVAWCSIDNDDSRDLDQLTVAAPLPGGGTRLMVAVADVGSSVAPGCALDSHARVNTTSVYTPPQNFPMLPERLSTDLTSLGQGEDRVAIVIETVVDGDGSGGASSVYRAVVHNQAKLTYSSVGAWLEGRGAMPAAVGAIAGLADNLRLQDQAAQRLKAQRHEHGALELETLEVHARFDGDAVSGLVAEERNRAKEIIEDFMIAANGGIVRFLSERRFPVLRRVVRSPERWQRIVDIAVHYGDRLPSAPDASALHDFLVRRRATDPLRFPDLSLSVIKLLGRGEYEASFPEQEVIGHFGLAVSDYTHSTAPNRRCWAIGSATNSTASSPAPPPPGRGRASSTRRSRAASSKVRRVSTSAIACACHPHRRGARVHRLRPHRPRGGRPAARLRRRPRIELRSMGRHARGGPAA
jgi:exoribonuclease-2